MHIQHKVCHPSHYHIILNIYNVHQCVASVHTLGNKERFLRDAIRPMGSSGFVLGGLCVGESLKLYALTA